MLYLFSSFDGIIINITTGILNEPYNYFSLKSHIYDFHISTFLCPPRQAHLKDNVAVATSAPIIFLSTNHIVKAT
jgi:hypothetical protein